MDIYRVLGLTLSLVTYGRCRVWMVLFTFLGSTTTLEYTAVTA